MRPFPANRPLARNALEVVAMLPRDSIRPELRSRLQAMLRRVIRGGPPGGR
jgi:hypothetical protein